MDTQTPSGPLKPADKLVGTIIALAVLGGLGWGLAILLPILIALAENVIVFGLECVMAIVLVMVFGDPNTWRNIYYAWKNVSRNIRKGIVREDPIGVLDTVIHRMASKLDDIDGNIVQATAAKARQAQAITKAKKSSQSELDLATAAKKMGKSLPEIQQHASAAKRWSDAADSLQPMCDDLVRVQTCLERARDLCSARLADMKDQKAVLAIKLEAMQDGQKAVRSFKRFFGNNADLDMQDLALEEIERQSTEAEAEIDQFMRAMDPVLEGADLKKQAEAMQAMEKFDTFLGTGEKKALPAAADNVVPMTKVKEGVVVR